MTARPPALAPAVIEAAYVSACLAELAALKPGNVHRFAPGHGMDVAVFERSAAVSAPEIAASGRTVGHRVLSAVEATWSAVGMNTNLGILLLCAPLAAAAEAADIGDDARARLRLALGGTLDALSEPDATSVFRAIAIASPGGLGQCDEHDVRTPPTISLVGTMRIAAPRDSVARQYANRFADVFEVGLPAIDAARAVGETGMWPVIRCFFAFATAFPDSHVARKYGAERAALLQEGMRLTCNRMMRMDNDADRKALLLALDAELKAGGINPGTSADLTVASLFADDLARRLEECGRR